MISDPKTIFAIAFLIGFPVLVYVAWRVGRAERAGRAQVQSRRSEWTIPFQVVRTAQAVLEYLQEHGGRDIDYRPHAEVFASLGRADADPASCPVEDFPFRLVARFSEVSDATQVDLILVTGSVKPSDEMKARYGKAFDAFEENLRGHLEKRRKEHAEERHPAQGMSDEEKATLRQVTGYDVYDLYATRTNFGRVRVGADHPLPGILGIDATDEYFLTPEPDDRGPGLSAIRLWLDPELVAGPVYGKVRIAGIYDDEKGFWVEKIEGDGEE